MKYLRAFLDAFMHAAFVPARCVHLCHTQRFRRMFHFLQLTSKVCHGSHDTGHLRADFNAYDQGGFQEHCWIDSSALFTDPFALSQSAGLLDPPVLKLHTPPELP